MNPDEQHARVRCACGAELEVKTRSNLNRLDWIRKMVETFYAKHEACLESLDTKKD